MCKSFFIIYHKPPNTFIAVVRQIKSYFVISVIYSFAPYRLFGECGMMSPL